uniref:Uncharacterized protein n=1 Tax=Schistosoma japonicum TaxID=6182 RepID=Q5BYJ5_SCHJA|nr:unknown [Schistosoma japonicum]
MSITALEEISPPTIIRPLLTNDSHATLASGSCFKNSSSMASLI